MRVRMQFVEAGKRKAWLAEAAASAKVCEESGVFSGERAFAWLLEGGPSVGEMMVESTSGLRLQRH